jgi:EmrB/QacA subfamily drug resistance transporter
MKTPKAKAEKPPKPPATVVPGRATTVAALLIVLLLSALDQTVVSTAMPRIIAELQGLELYAWVTTIYLLTSTVMVPIWGKLGDLYGRKAILLWGIGLFVLGSMLCGLSGEFGSLPILGGGMSQLIVFRGLQGIGGGALMTSAFAVMADLYPPRERGKFAGYFGATFGLASIAGPIIGGFLTEHGTASLGGVTVEGWRWCFYVNLPLSILAMFMITSRAPALGAGRGGKVDVLGALLIFAAFVPLLLALSWGGHQYAWNSPLVLGLFAITAVSLALFAVAEHFAPEPILPLYLFKSKAFTLTNAAGFVLGMAFFGALTFLPLYMQLGLGIPATESGLAMLPMMFGLIFGAAMSGRLVLWTGKYKPWMIIGALILLVGMVLMTFIGPDTTTWSISARMLILGLGLGPSQSLFPLVVQNAVPREQLGVATSSNQFFRQIGATVGVAIFGAIMTQALAVEMARASAGAAHKLTLDELQKMAISHAGAGAHAAKLAIDPAVKVGFSAAMADVLWVGAGFGVLALLMILLIPVIPLKTHAAPEPLAEPGEGFDRPQERPA